MKKPLTALALALATTGAFAQYSYKCVSKDGRSQTFQQTPCASTHEQTALRAPSAPPDQPAAAAPAQKQPTVEQRMLASMERERRIRELQQDIAAFERTIANRNAVMQAEMDALRSRKALANNNLAGATYEQSLSTEMQAVAMKYKAMNDLDMERVKQLREQLASAQR